MMLVSLAAVIITGLNLLANRRRRIGSTLNGGCCRARTPCDARLHGGSESRYSSRSSRNGVWKRKEIMGSPPPRKMG